MLVVDVGGTNVKILATGQKERRKFPSGTTLTPEQMVSEVKKFADDWRGKPVDPDLLFILGEIYQLQAAIARERREAFGKIWEPFSSEETMMLLKEILHVQPAAES